jgi:hypothetical protein
MKLLTIVSFVIIGYRYVHKGWLLRGPFSSPEVVDLGMDSYEFLFLVIASGVELVDMHAT